MVCWQQIVDVKLNAYNTKVIICEMIEIEGKRSTIHMNKKKVLIIGIFVIFLIIAIVTICFVAQNVTSKKEAMNALNTRLSMPKTLVEGEETPATIQYIEESSNYTVLSFKQHFDGTATAKIKVSALDLYTVVRELDSTKTQLNNDQLEMLILQGLKDAKRVETEMTLTFVKKNGVYQPQLTSEFLDAYYGGAFRLYEELLLEYVKEKQ